ncbi:MAG: CHRD domain-containing protein [Balneolaceae bacterium]
MNTENLYPNISVTASLLLSFLMILTLMGCDVTDSDDDEIGLTNNSESYEVQSTEGFNVEGSVIFEERTDGTTLITIDLDGTIDDGEHPAHIHANAVVEGGGIDIPLNPVDGNTGSSETVVETLGNGTPVSYEELVNYNGHFMIHLSPNDLSTIIGRTDIGGNALTGESVTYDLDQTGDVGGVGGSGVSGIVRFEERKNENTLITIEVTGTSEEGDHPAHIHENSVEEGGGVVVPLNNVDGETGMSATNIRADETSVDNLTYSALIVYNGYVNVHQSGSDSSVISQGNIGSNAEE